jgi:hypothetical protein
MTNGGVEICDGIDNDCNGIIDDNFNLQTDPQNCGQCGHHCNFQNAVGACDMGVCRLDRCLPNFYDIDGNPANGCEYGCLVSNGGVEICDGLDNDCNGMIDDNPIDAGQACFPFGSGCTPNGSGGFTCVGACRAGTTTCANGFLQCNGYVGPSAEVCDNLDNDCNGVVDDPFNKQTDPLHCGSCSPCVIPHAIPSCTNGVCGIAACQIDFHDIDGNVGNGCEYFCHFTGPEVCDGVDNNCNGQIDEGFDKQNDPNNCGPSCTRCSFAHAGALCQAGTCAMGACDPGWVNLDGNPANGCEYQCTVTSQTEICNGVDDNCNGQIDEGFNLQTDVNNCGMCNHRCQFANAAASCQAGVCVMGACNAGFVNLDGNPANGCEYQCTITNGGVEICDGRDNNCNGQIDEGNPGAGQACNPALSDMTRWNTGTCRAGTTACTNGNLVCNGYVGPTPEICDNLDNDCNGIVDDPFNKQSDPNNCGSCGHICQNDFTATTPNAIAGCQAGACVIAACTPGFYNNDGQFANGCEYACAGTPGTPEVCDGVDNDCDGLVDAADTHTCTQNSQCPQAALGETCTGGHCSFDLQTVSNFCAQLGACSGSHPVCSAPAGGGQVQWICNYDHCSGSPNTLCTTTAQCPAGQTCVNDVQLTGINQIIGNETLCDGKDNDCDGCIDESYPAVGLTPDPVGGTCTATAPQLCSDSGIGACQGHGHQVCNATHDGTTCMITNPGATPVQETCNGIDDDCDGLVDENTDDAAGTTRCGGVRCLRVIDDMVQLTGSPTLYVFRFEASRPDATGTAGGALANRACSRQNVVPWTNLTYPQAVAACTAAGKRLCTEAEWQRACQSSTGTCNWSFATNCSTTPASGADPCNTQEYDTDPITPGNQDSLIATGSLANCYASWGAAATAHIFDMSGNAKEWTQARSAGVNPLRGGSFNNILDGSTCTFNFTVADDTFQFPNVGYRCCSSTAP